MKNIKTILACVGMVASYAAGFATHYIIEKKKKEQLPDEAEATYTTEDLKKVADAWRESYNELLTENARLRGAKSWDELAEESKKAMEELDEDEDEEDAKDAATYDELATEYGSEYLKNEEPEDMYKNCKPAKLSTSVLYHESDDLHRDLMYWFNVDEVLTDENFGLVCDSVYLSDEVLAKLAETEAPAIYIEVPRFNKVCKIKILNKSFYETCALDPDWQERHPDDISLIR